MSRRRGEFQGLVHVNQTLGQVSEMLPALERDVSSASASRPGLEDLVVSLHGLRTWLTRTQELTPASLPVARLRFEGISDSIHRILRLPEARDLGPLKVRLAALGLLLHSLTKFRS